MPQDAADYYHEKLEAQLEPDDGLTGFEVEAYRTIEIVAPPMLVRAHSLQEAIDVAEFELGVEGTVLDRVEWNSAEMLRRGCEVLEDHIRIRRVE